MAIDYGPLAVFFAVNFLTPGVPIARVIAATTAFIVATVAAMTTQPLLLLGGAPGPDPAVTFAAWEAALAEPTVRGLVVGRALLYPADGDVAAAVAAAATLVEHAAKERV